MPPPRPPQPRNPFPRPPPPGAGRRRLPALLIRALRFGHSDVAPPGHSL